MQSEMADNKGKLFMQK